MSAATLNTLNNLFLLKMQLVSSLFFLKVFVVVLPEELLAYEAKRREAEENTRAPPEPVRARIPFTACLQAFTEPENVPDFWSSALQAKSAGVKYAKGHLE